MRAVIAATTKSAEDTRELGATIAGLARPGDVIILSGDLGAGKTTFAQGFGRALGITEPITSPTFTLMRDYAGPLRLLHLDIYRLDRVNEVLDLGLHELLEEGAVALVEWGDVVAPALASTYLDLALAHADPTSEQDDERHLTIRTVGPSWQPRAAALQRALERWTVEP